MNELDYRRSMEARNSVTLNSNMDSFDLINLLRNLPKDIVGEDNEKCEILTLHRVDLDYNTVYEIIDQLFRWSQVEFDDSSGHHMYALLNAILKHENIKHLSIIGDELDPDSVEAMKEGLCSCYLHELVLFIELTREAATSIILEGINNAPSILKLDLSQCEISPDSIEVICQALETNESLVSLNLENCRLQDDEIAEILLSLQDNQSLQHLSLAMNYAEDEAMNAASRLLQSPTSRLKSLNLAQQNPGTLDLLSLSAGLRENKKLQRLDLYESFVDKQHMAAFAEVLTVNTTLRELNFENCGLKDSILSLLLVQLKRFTGLQKLYIKKNELSKQLDPSTIRGNFMLQVLDVEDRLMHPQVYIDLALNRGGRQYLDQNMLPMGLWPTLFERVNRYFQETSDDQAPSRCHHGFSSADALFYLIKGSVF
ncbi:unnamed protein product [Cylindrotheca closterium]|uniref:Uncharacterized protein n=1 Tax=Cylindrotheca closterium TaxID=2856 RepID=A0AAD2FQG1_9STRA|nr:unnamed protein product [Cylindrotheca closterium]